MSMDVMNLMMYYYKKQMIILQILCLNQKWYLPNPYFRHYFILLTEVRKKSPLHVMRAHTIYNDKCKGKGLITSLNRLGFCISYTEYKRCRALLSAYAYYKGKNEHVPLPAHLSTNEIK